MHIWNLHKIPFYEIALKFSPPEWYQEPALAHELLRTVLTIPNPKDTN